jgi:cytochrome oxidase Cu insertion factor (SCO1/SenC/PrrC family)
VSVRRCVLSAAAAGLCLALGCTTFALADGDPASDYLYSQPVFMPAGSAAALQAQVRAAVVASDQAGAPIKVAVIGSAYDLGSITPLWRRPQTYARFLGAELSDRYRGLLLIVMPNGFGLSERGSSVTADERALTGIRIQSGTTGLAAAATAAVRRLAAVRGHPLPAAAGGPPASTAAGIANRRPVLVAIVAGLLLIAAALTFSLRRRRLRMPVWTASLRAAPSRPAVLLGIVTLVASAALLAILVTHRPPSTAQAGAAAASRTGVSWPAGSRPAPGFRLRDQRGQAVSMKALRGRVVILAFVDPVCRNLCPLEAAILGRAERELRPSMRPVIVAVSVDPWGDAHANLVHDVRRWRVGPDWRWAVGSRAALSHVWGAYKVGVQARKLVVGGQTVHEITHDELIYVIDQHGDERLLYPYPFSAAQVVRAVTRLGTSSA